MLSSSEIYIARSFELDNAIVDFIEHFHDVCIQIDYIIFHIMNLKFEYVTLIHVICRNKNWNENAISNARYFPYFAAAHTHTKRGKVNERVIQARNDVNI